MARARSLSVALLLAASASAVAIAACTSFGSDTPPGAAVEDAASEAASAAESGASAGDAAADADADAAAPSPFCPSAPPGAFCEDFEEPSLSANKWRLTQCTVDAGYHCTMAIEDAIGEAASRHLVMTATDKPSAEIDAPVTLSAGATTVRFAFRTRVVSASVSVLAASLQLVAADKTKTYLNFRADASTWRATWEDDTLAQRGFTDAPTLAAGWHSVVMEIALPTGGTCSQTNAVTNAVAGVSVDGAPPRTIPICVPGASTSAVVEVGAMVTATPSPPAVLHFDDLLFTTR
jgi:hypothetical protein